MTYHNSWIKAALLLSLTFLCAFGAFAGEADIKIPPPQPIKRVQAANRIVPLQNADSLLVIGQSDASRQAGQTGANDDGVVAQRRVSQMTNDQ